MIFSSPYGELFCSVHFAQDVMVAVNVCFWVVGDVVPTILVLFIPFAP